MIKTIDLWKSINRINQRRSAVRYYNFKHPDRYKHNYIRNNHRSGLRECACGCGQMTYIKWAVGHQTRINPKPENFGKIRKGIEHPNWKGGVIIRDGYKYIYNPTHPNTTIVGYVLEHRVIMEKYLKRYLTKEEVVHHGNGNKLDNRFENLVLQENQAEHNKNYHIRVRDKQGRFISGGVFL